ncbi:hypothetical protein LJK88_05930 [Paenibacillus sp. P26]|nr:hypothetical protein LJK88_05930 [Paenibacillus sp. P26]UUZ90431.1 hypothetical protein LJK87_31575 [Paenibacillus sp. P25]
MENLNPMPNVMPYAANPNVMPYAAPNVMPMATAPMNVGPHPYPVNISYEEVNIYAPKKHCHYPVGWTSAGVILVLYILLVIVLRSFKI